eukprot:1192444-Prorocentrum_minimum.AAC.1
MWASSPLGTKCLLAKVDFPDAGCPTSSTSSCAVASAGVKPPPSTSPAEGVQRGSRGGLEGIYRSSLDA